MTIIRTTFLAALGLLVAGSVAPASAGALVATAPTSALDNDAASVHLVTDRHRGGGSWVEPRTRWKGDYDRGRDRHYDRYDDRRHHKKHFKKKKKKKYYKRGYRRGYDEGYYEGRRHSRFERRHRRRHHHHYPDYGFRGGVYFGDSYFRGGSFGFRY